MWSRQYELAFIRGCTKVVSRNRQKPFARGPDCPPAAALAKRQSFPAINHLAAVRRLGECAAAVPFTPPP